MNRLSNIFKCSTWWRIALKPCKRCPVSINNPFGAFPCSENSSSWAHPQGAMWWQRLFSMDIPALSSTVPCWNSLQGTVINLSAGEQHPAGELSESPRCSSDEQPFLAGGQKRLLCSSFFMTGLKLSSKIPTKVNLDSPEGQRFIHSVRFCSMLFPSL